MSSTGSPDVDDLALTVPDLEGVGRGALWSGMSTVALRAGTLLMGIVTARILAPRDLGVFAVALTVHTILLSASELGIGAAITRRTTDVSRMAGTLGTIAIGTGSLMAAAMALTAEPVARAMGAAAATPAVRVLALTLVINGAATVPAALLARDFRQDKRFLAEVIGFALSSVVLVVLLSQDWGVMGLAWSRVAGSLAFCGTLFAVSTVRYRLGFDPAEARHLLRFGLPLTGAALVGFVLANLDYVIVGRELGGVTLGLYVLAYTISGWPISIFTSIVMGVGVPAFARVQRDPEQLPRHVVSAVRVLLTAALPVSALTVALARPLIEVLYGGRWMGAAAVLAVLAAFGAIRVPIDLFANLLVALGATRRLLIIQVVWLVALAPALVVGVRTEGLVGAAAAHLAVVGIIVIPIYLVLVRRMVGVTPRQLAGVVWRPVVAAVIGGSLAWLAASAFDIALVSLVAGTIVGLAAYVIVLGSALGAVLHECRTLWSGADRTPTPSPAGIALEAS